jgi:hypothetical protein
MKSNYPAAILANFDHDYQAAYAHLAKAFLALERQHIEESSSRFFEVSRFEPDSDICLRQVTEQQISRSVDMSDCEPDFVMRKRFYVDDAGDIQPVTIGDQDRFHNGVEQPFYFAASDILAGGKCVGQVVYTDH